MSENKYPHLFSTAQLGPLTLRNRVIMGSMHMRFELTDNPVERMQAFYGARARGGVAMIITGGVAPNAEAAIEEGAPLLRTKKDVEHWRQVVDTVHDEGALFILQILHAGRYAKVEQPMGASSLASRINPRKISAMTDADIARTLNDFETTAQLAYEAGFDGVEIMGSEGYLLNQFAIERTNDRTDDWGGDLERRHRFPVEVVRRVRATTPSDRLLIYRISAIDLVEKGSTADETNSLTQKLEQAGVQAFNTGIGWHESRVPTIAAHVPPGGWRFATARMKKNVNVPVICSNRVNTPELAEEIIASGEADCVSMARPLLADPDFAVKANTGRAREINICIACNQGCLDYIFTDRVATCLVNPRAGREAEVQPLRVNQARRIAIIGAGPAGLSCAVTAAARGHQVTIFDEADEIGGQFNLARLVPSKSEFGDSIAYFDSQLQRFGVRRKLGHAVESDGFDKDLFDIVVVATGVLPNIPDIEGITHEKVVSYSDILTGRVNIGNRVAILGAGGIAMDVAHFLTRDDATIDSASFCDAWGVDPSLASAGGVMATPTDRQKVKREITLFRRSGKRMGNNLGLSTVWILRGRLQTLGVDFVPKCSLFQIDDLGLHYTTDGQMQLFSADTIVNCSGQIEKNELSTSLKARGIEVYIIGGASMAGDLDALAAISQGVGLGETL